MNKKPLKIGLVGGGSGGPLTPLLAVRRAILKSEPDAEFLYFGGSSAPERRLLAELPLRRFRIPAGKWRRYFSWRNFFDVALVFVGFVKSLALLFKTRPDALFSAGSYVSVPVAYAASILRIPVIIHQQDVVTTLSNRLVAPVAAQITVSLPESVKDFFSTSGLFRQRRNSKAVYTGNPVREDIEQGTRPQAVKLFKLEPDLPTLLVLGGGGGAMRLNLGIASSLPQLTKVFQVIHVTGQNGSVSPSSDPRYHVYDFLGDELPHALAVADIVISRAGFATISEIIALEKVSILIPIPNSHQEANALYLFNRGAAIAFSESGLKAEKFLPLLRNLLFDMETQKRLRAYLRKLQTPQAAAKVAALVIACARKSKI